MSEPKKILIITYYWPPSGGPGVQRWLKFVKYLPQFGWKPTVFIPENPSYPIIDESLIKELSEGTEVIKTQIWEPYQLAEIFGKENKKFKAGQFDIAENQSWKSKLSIWVRGNFFIPDARVFWVRPSFKYLKKYLEEHHFDALVTTGPPHSVHLIGLKLKRIFPQMKWIADFRDPWTEISYYKHLKLTRFADRKHHQLESEVFNNADITLATSYTDAENFKKKGAHAICITNGFDEVEFNSNTAETRSTPSLSAEKFTLSYIGVLEQLRNPEVLWKVLNKIIAEYPTFQKDFQLKFVGRVDDKILETLKNSPLEPCINNLGYLSHSEANNEMHDSSALLITNFPSEMSRGIIPGKIFEYLATGQPIVSFGPTDADVEKILKQTNAGQHFLYTDEQPLKKYILELYQNWKAGDLAPKTLDIQAFSRRNLTQKLAEVLATKF